MVDIGQSRGARTRKVGNLKRGIVAVIVILLLVMIIWPLTSYGPQQLKLTFESAELAEGEDNRPKMVAPKLQGVDKKQRPYTITSDEAIQESKDLMLLKNLDGKIDLGESKWVTLSAETGDYRIEGKTLDLNGDVVVTNEGGNVMKTESAFVDLIEGSSTGNELVTITGPRGSLKAAGFIAKESGDYILFHGGVTMRILRNGGES